MSLFYLTNEHPVCSQWDPFTFFSRMAIESHFVLKLFGFHQVHDRLAGVDKLARLTISLFENRGMAMLLILCGEEYHPV